MKNIAPALLLLFSYFSYGQRADVVFGKNNVQYKNFKWKHIVSKHFDVYYYQGGNELAHNAARYAEEDLDRISHLIGFDVDQGRKITLIIYNSFADLQQSNIGIEDYYMVGGKAHLIKSKIEIAFPGTQSEFKKEITDKVTGLLVKIMMFGGSLKDMVQNANLYHIPDWFISGISSYAGSGWDAESEMRIRKMDLSGLRKPAHANPEDADLIGRSIWNFVVKKYGENAIQNILHITGIVNSIEVGISSSLALSYSTFIEEWKAYYNQPSGEATELTGFNSIELRKAKNAKIIDAALSPDKRKIAYVKIVSGKHKVMVYDIAKKESTTVVKGGHLTPYYKIQPHSPAISWRAPGILGVVQYKKGYLQLVMTNVNNGDQVAIPFKRFEQIVDLDFSDDGKKVVFSAVHKGRTDLYEYDLDKKKMTPLTANLFDELDPVYLPNGQSIIFSSNRINDTLSFPLGRFYEITDNFDLYQVNTTDLSVSRLTYTNSAEFSPIVINDKEILYRKDYDLKRRLFKLNLETLESFQLTTNDPGIINFDYQQETFVYNALQSSKYDIAFKPKFTFNTVQKDQIDNDSIVYPGPTDSVRTVNSIEDIEVNNLVFETDVARADSANSDHAKSMNNRVWLANPRPYEKMLGVEQVTSTFMIDQLRGSGVLMEFNMVEMMGDHYFKAGMFGLTDLKSSSFFGEYRYLKRREDYYLKFDKRSIFAISDEAAHLYTSNTIDLDIAYPFNVSNRIAISPFYMHTRYTDMNVLSIPDGTQNYGGIGFEYVFDNTVVHDLNQIRGTRAKFEVNNYINAGDKSRNFGKVKVDIRHYQKVSRNIIFASRASGGIFFGNSKKNFLMGGLDNWLFSNTNIEQSNDPLNLQFLTDNSDLLFVDYATGMRGFNYNHRNGNKFFLLNFELRVPLIRYFKRSPGSSTFFRHLQLTTFYDIGSAWSGSSPFSKNNSFNTQIIGGSGNPFTANVTNYRNPFLAAYGFGARTVLLGYYVKVDVAWGIEDFTVKSPMAYLTFGYDF